MKNLHQNKNTSITLLSIAFILSCFLFLYYPYNEQEKVAIIILGGGLKDNGSVPLHTQARIDKAIELYKMLNENAVIITLSGGTTHKPNPLDSSGFPIWEATAAARRLIDMGIPPHNILEEAFSLDTIGNVS